jgi:hypothetical protein
MLRSSSEREGGSGFIYTWIDYTNVSGAACIRAVPPKLHLTDKQGNLLTVDYEITSYDGRPEYPEYTFETAGDSTSVILPALESAQIIVVWYGRCPPPTSDGIVAHLTLSASDDVHQSVIVNEPRSCDEEDGTADVRLTGFKRIPGASDD